MRSAADRRPPCEMPNVYADGDWNIEKCLDVEFQGLEMCTKVGMCRGRFYCFQVRTEPITSAPHHHAPAISRAAPPGVVLFCPSETPFAPEKFRHRLEPKRRKRRRRRRRSRISNLNATTKKVVAHTLLHHHQHHAGQPTLNSLKRRRYHQHPPTTLIFNIDPLYPTQQAILLYYSFTINIHRHQHHHHYCR